MPWIPTRPLADSSGWRPAAALMALTLLTATEPGLAAPLNQVERCDGGGLGQGVLRSGPVRMSRTAGQTVAAARINVAVRGINQEGILHSVMGAATTAPSPAEKAMTFAPPMTPAPPIRRS